MMSGSETEVMTSREPFGVPLQKSPVQSQPLVSNMRLTFSADGTAVYKPATPGSLVGNASVEGDGFPDGAIVSHGVNINMVSEPMKKKRGRPRKYAADGPTEFGRSPAPPPSSGGFSSSPTLAVAPASGGSGSLTSLKKPRGRPPGPSKKQQLDALGSTGVSFTPHVITVKAGEDVSSKIMSFSQNGSRAVCVLSANGAVSNVTLRQPATSGGTVTYEGRFEILSLSGSYMLSENGGQRSRTGGLSVSLSGPDGRVIGGGVAGLLTAASPLQVIVGSFIIDRQKELKARERTVEMYSEMGRNDEGETGVNSPSHGTVSESSGRSGSGSGSGSPLNQSWGAYNNNINTQAMSNMPWK